MSKYSTSFSAFFSLATGLSGGPYWYQQQLAGCDVFPTLLNIPTGLGKTAAVILAWLYRRRAHPDPTVRKSTPRRLIYCLPMRTLVEQTAQNAREWIGNLGTHGQFGNDLPAVSVLMGGEERTKWDEQPETEAILIGTQDMLLSRALNRGYGMSRYRWPMPFSLLNNDCLWVLDETQLMGVGLTTSAQLQGLREKLTTYGVARSLWMSATLDEESLTTVDHTLPKNDASRLGLTTDDMRLPTVQKLFGAEKPCQAASFKLTPGDKAKAYEAAFAAEIVNEHRRGTLTLAIVNRVERAQDVYRAIEKHYAKDTNAPDLCLIHARFRPAERGDIQQSALDEKTIVSDGPGRIVVSTQAVEAGVDISAATLFTELAPWPSLVQRFGRCNRRGVCGADGRPEAQVFWIDVDTSDAKKATEPALPYSIEELDNAREHVKTMVDVGPRSLATIEHVTKRPVVHTLRRKDLIELWDTTPDLAGNDLDVSRYIRDADDTDVQVYWRDWNIKTNHGSPPDPLDESGHNVFSSPLREELCAVSTHRMRGFLSKLKVKLAWRWDPLEQGWQPVDGNRVRPGMVVLLHVDAGGYDAKLGWTGVPSDKPEPRPLAPKNMASPEANGDDALGRCPMLLTEHLQRVTEIAENLKKSLEEPPVGIPWDSLVTAAQWHDVGKAHEAFQNVMRDHDAVLELDPKGEQLWAKSGGKGFPRYRVMRTDGTPDTRPGFRHELASALAWLVSADGQADADLVAFLIAAHHGKVRGSIRSLPNEKQPPDPRVKFARGLWEGDEIAAVDLGNGRTTPQVTVDLSLMELGENERGQPSWLARVLKLRDEYGPFRLAYLEMLLRIADWRGSNEDGSNQGEQSDV